MSNTQILSEELFPKRDPLAGVTVDLVGPEIAAALGVQDAIAKDTAELLETCKQWVRRFVIVSNEQAEIMAAWLLHTYVFGVAESTPYIHITAPEKACGKSTLMEVLEALAATPVDQRLCCAVDPARDLLIIPRLVAVPASRYLLLQMGWFVAPNFMGPATERNHFEDGL